MLGEVLVCERCVPLFKIELFPLFFFSFLSSESEEADKLEELKKTTNEENSKSNKRRMKFQAQDSVLVDTFGGSQEE